MTDRKLLFKAAELFNRKCYFECHELLEDEWRGTCGEDKRFLQGLIMVAVGMVHVVGENYKGAVNVLEKGLTRLEPFVPERHGLDLERLCAACRRALEKARRGLTGEAVVWAEDDVPLMEML